MQGARLPNPRNFCIFKHMKNTVGYIILIIVCIALGVTLIVRNNQATKQKQQDEASKLELSNHLQESQVKLSDAEQVNRTLENDLKARKEDIGRLTNDLAKTAASLAKTETTLKATEEEVKKRDTKIAELESVNQQLDKQAADLSASITNLNNKITETQRKLTAAEGDKAFLQKELERLIAEKTELEKQFNDLAVLRQQVKHLKEELSIARRIEWIRQGLFGAGETKGAQQLMQNLGATLSKTKTNYDLNVEINADGSVKVIAPLQNTNVPQFQPAPPK